MGVVRPPAVAGAFYPANPGRLRSTVAALFPADSVPRPALGVMLPHAGYVYSGAAAGRTLATVTVPRTVLLIGPNHTGRGAAIALAPEEAWLTPLGKVPIERALLEAIAAACPEARFDGAAHAGEHALEVLVPLLHERRADLRIAPIVVGTHEPARLERLAEAVAAALAAHGDPEPPLLVVSSDMSHYLSAEHAERLDRMALERVEALDAAGLLEVVARERITMCGAAPAAVALEALRRLGATRGETVVYTHSGHVTGDFREVVAYAGMVFTA